MDFSVIDFELVAKLLLLLLIGMGPKIALVPFLEKTKNFDAETQRAVGRRMVVTAVVTALVLFATSTLGNVASRQYERAQDVAKDTVHQTEKVIRRNPFGAILTALGLGFLLGLFKGGRR
jgi:multisubunit Na+/H+ antiporter MnhC subunit